MSTGLYLSQWIASQMDRKQVNIRSHNLVSARWATVLLVVFLLGTAGCEFLGLDGSGEPAGQSAQKQAGNQADQGAAKEQPASAEKADEVEYERPEYPDQVRRNPFLPDLDIVRPKKQLAEGDIGPRGPLEEYGLGQLELVAIISEVAVPKAMFLDPDGFGHVVKEGDRIGQNGGTITDIRDNEVEVREVADEEDTQTRLTTIELTNDELQRREDDGLSEQERQAIQKLLESEEGRKAAQDSLEQMAPGAAASERQQRGGRGGR
jgi:type IV pilus assembly protein PilP